VERKTKKIVRTIKYPFRNCWPDKQQQTERLSFTIIKKPMPTGTARVLIIIGLVFVVVGVLYYFLGDKLQWLGRLPGDIRIEREHTRVYIPITTMLLISLLLTIILNIIRRFL